MLRFFTDIDKIKISFDLHQDCSLQGDDRFLDKR